LKISTEVRVTKIFSANDETTFYRIETRQTKKSDASRHESHGNHFFLVSWQHKNLGIFSNHCSRWGFSSDFVFYVGRQIALLTIGSHKKFFDFVPMNVDVTNFLGEFSHMYWLIEFQWFT
jgi:hypothetical protein